MKEITMTLSSPDANLVNGKGSLTASVRNGSPTSQRVVLGAFPGDNASPVPPPSPTWTTIERPLRTIAAGSTEQYLVTFDTTAAPPGTYPVRLIAYSADEAPEEYSDHASVVHLVVPAPPRPVPPPKFPWWIVIAAAALAVVGIVVFVLIRGASPKLTAVRVDPATVTLQTGATQQLKAVGTFSDGSTKDLTGAAWRSNNPTVADVNGVGLVSARGVGSVSITASQGGLEGSASVSVSTVLTAITVTPPNVTLQFGQQSRLTAIGTFSDGTVRPLTDVTWRSTDPAVRVGQDGSIVGVGVKDLVEVIASRDGVQAVARVTVLPLPTFGPLP